MAILLVNDIKVTDCKVDFSTLVTTFSFYAES